MGQWKKNKDGRFAGSIGSGKDQVPTPHPLHTAPKQDVAGTENQSNSEDLKGLAEKVRAKRSIPKGEPSPHRFLALSGAEREVQDAEERWENARTWAYPGVGDEEAETELAEAYENLSLARENLNRARILVAQTAEGRDHLETEMASWNDKAIEAAETGEGALKYLVRAQEIYDSLFEARRQQEVEEEFQKIIGQSNTPSGSV